MKKRLERIAKYLGSRGLYKEAAQINKIAQDDQLIVELDQQNGGKIFSFKDPQGFPYYFNSGNGVLSGESALATKSVGEADEITESNYKRILGFLLQQDDLTPSDYRAVSNWQSIGPYGIKFLTQSGDPRDEDGFLSPRINPPESTVPEEYSLKTVPSIRLEGNILYYMERQAAYQGSIPTTSYLNSFNVNLNTGAISGDLTDDIETSVLLTNAYKEGLINYNVGTRFTKAYLKRRYLENSRYYKSAAEDAYRSYQQAEREGHPRMAESEIKIKVRIISYDTLYGLHENLLPNNLASVIRQIAPEIIISSDDSILVDKVWEESKLDQIWNEIGKAVR